MYNFLSKHGTSAAMGLGTLVTIIFIISLIMGLSSSGYDTSTNLLDINYKEVTAFNSGLFLTMVLCVVALLLMLGGVIIDLAKNYKTSMKMIIGIVALIIMFIILYTTATYNTGGKWDFLNSEFKITENSSKLITAGINTCGILALAAIASIVISEVRNFFK